MQGLYIHIPFCNYICTYCDFKKELAKDSKKSSYVNSLITELESFKEDLKDIKTIYIGGGTPLSLSVYLLNQLLSKINELVDMNLVEEFTVETNPDNIDEEKIKILKQYGVNRLSIGVQTTSNRLLKWMGRPYEKAEIIDKLGILKQCSFENYSLDMIFGLPFQTIEEIDADLLFIEESGAKHVSYYNLIIEEKSILGRRQSFDWQSDENDVELYQHLKSRLCKKFKQYEISNFAKDGYESKHNLLYWTMKPYLGIGVSAHSFDGRNRTFQTYNTKKYIDSGGLIKQTEEPTNLLEETIILGLRLINGLSLSDIHTNFKVDLLNRYPVFNEWIIKEYLKIDGDMLSFTDKGFFIQNELFLHIIGE
jgi:oxygen-independent coproporphyrinogen-3 oxidase